MYELIKSKIFRPRQPWEKKICSFYGLAHLWLVLALA